MMDNPIYLDYNATTPIDSRVLEMIEPLFSSKFGNAASSSHQYGHDAKRLVERSRMQLANGLGCKSNEVIFTSGATEAINMAIKGIVSATHKEKKHIVTIKTEHKAVLDSCDHVAKNGVEVDYISVDDNGQVSTSDIEAAIRPETILVIAMHGNNEIGNILDIDIVSSLCNDMNVIFHSDTVQTIGHYNFDLDKLGAHAIIGSAHKLHGPKGVGFLYLNNSQKISPFIHGGSQERNMRGGTENVYGIVGLAEALELADSNLENHKKYILELKQRMINGLKSKIKNIKFNGESANLNNSLYTILNVAIPDIEDQQMFLFNLDINNISASAGSACTSGSDAGSHVLQEIQHHKKHVSVRFSFSKNNTIDEVDYVIDKIIEIKNL